MVRAPRDGDTLTVWTSLKSNLRNCARLEQLVSRHSNVDHVTGRGGGFIRAAGPVLMAWPDMDDIGELVRHGGVRIRALCIVTWNEDEIRPWVTAVSPTILGDGSAWEDLTPELDPVVVEAMKSLTQTINHNNTISAGFDKDMVVSTLHDARIPIDGDAMQGWALAQAGPGRIPSGSPSTSTTSMPGNGPGAVACCGETMSTPFAAAPRTPPRARALVSLGGQHPALDAKLCRHAFDRASSRPRLRPGAERPWLVCILR